MVEARRLPVIAVLAALVVAGAVVGGPSGAGSAAPSGDATALQVSSVPAVALSSSWFCAGATEAPDSVAAGQLLFDNAGARPVAASVELVSQSGYRTNVSLTVPAGAATSVYEELPGLAGSNSDHWVGAIVTLYGGMASVSQVVTTPHGSASQPCASSASSQWFFADGATLRNAWDEISLLNPYPVPAVVDLSFSTDQGREEPLAFEGVVVRAHGLAVLNLGSHLRRRQHIALTVTARTGEIVAYQTEIVTPPPAGAPPIGAPGAVGALVVPVPGITLALGATEPATSLWWPGGGEGPGLTETYAIYNPGGAAASLTLTLLPGGGTGAGSSTELTVGGYGSALVTTNDEPWALPGASYATHLDSSNGVPVVAERFVMAGPPAPERGLAVLMGEAQPGDEWMLSDGLAAGRSLLSGQVLLGHVRLEVVDPGTAPAVVSLEHEANGRLAPIAGLGALEVYPGQRYDLAVPSRLAGQALVVASSGPTLLEQDWYSSLASVGTNLSPAMAISQP